MGGAARAIGNEELETKFDDAIKLLERPNTVVFNPSYVDAGGVMKQATLANSLLRWQAVSLESHWVAVEFVNGSGVRCIPYGEHPITLSRLADYIRTIKRLCSWTVLLSL